MTAAFCDTSVLIRYFAEDDVPRALAAAELIDSERVLLVSTVVLLETIHVLRTEFQFDNPGLAQLLVRFLTRSNVRVNDADKSALIAGLFAAQRTSARRIADAIVVAAAEQSDVEFIATFDEKMTSQLVPVRML